MSAAAGWQEGWSEEYGRRYYFNSALGHTQWHPPEADPPVPDPVSPPAAATSAAATSAATTSAAGTSSTKDPAELAIASALGFVDPVVHAIATKILADGCEHAAALKRLRRHLAEADAAACATAILERGGAPHDSDSDSDSAASSDAEAGTGGPGQSVAAHVAAAAAPWERAGGDDSCGASSEPGLSAEGLHALSVGELKRRVAAAGLDASICVEKVG